MQVCDTCQQAVPVSELVQVDTHFECMVCRGLKDRNADAAQYCSAANLAEDYGVFDPIEEGYRYVAGLGYTRG